MKKILILLFISILLSVEKTNAQTTTFTSGSYIINMGKTPQTVANSLKPYGLIYDLLKNYNVPVYWVINQSKIKDGIDFTYAGIDFKGGTFIVAKEYLTTAVINRFAVFGLAVNTNYTISSSPLTLDVTYTLKAAPRWTLDLQNGHIAAEWFATAGIPTTAYNWRDPQELNGCDDIFVMPHADPTWATHSNLYDWNRTKFGAIWAGCHAVSVLENMNNGTLQTNFLANNVGTIGNSLVLWKDHHAATPPYINQYPTAGAAQYMGKTDGSHTNGSEQVFLPKKGGSWRATTKLIVYDPTQSDIPTLSNGPAAIIAWGRGFGLNTSGWVMYEAGHNIAKATTPDNIAAQRAFWDFSYVAHSDKNPLVSTTTIPGTLVINSDNAVSVNASSPSGKSLSYLWSATRNGVPLSSSLFASPKSSSTTFHPTESGNYIIICTVSDACGHSTFESKISVVPSGPVAVPDVLTINPGCSGIDVGSINVLTNDSDPTGGTLSLTSVSLTGTPRGTIDTFSQDGIITFRADLGLNGPGNQVINYSVINSNGYSASSTLTITVGTGSAPTPLADSYTLNEDNIGRFAVLSNDGSSNLKIKAITSAPSHGKVSISSSSALTSNAAGIGSDNIIVYIPNPDFSGTTDAFTYMVENADGNTGEATVTVTITNDACDGGTYLPGSASLSLVSGNGWSHLGTNTAGGDPASSSYSYTVNSGSNRLLIVAVEVSVNDANKVPSTKTVTWGGKSLTFLSSNPSDGNRVFAYLYYLKESDIASASGNSLVVTMGGYDIYGFVAFAAVYQNVDQTTIVRNGASLASSTKTSSTATLGTADFIAGDQGIFIAGFGLNSATTCTYSSTGSGWTGSSSLFAGGTANGGAFYGGIATRNSTGAATNETTSMTIGTNEQRTSMSVISLIPGTSCIAIPARAPLSNPDYFTVANGTSNNTYSSASNDYMPAAGTNTYTKLTDPASGTASINATSGLITYTPSGTFNGIRTFSYTVSNSLGGLDTAIVYITITNGPIVAVNDAPAAANSGVTQTVTVTGNDSDPEGSIVANTHAVTIAVQPEHGTATVNGSKQIVYIPTPGYSGTDVLTYSLCEPTSSCGTAACSSATVTFTINNSPPEPPPVTHVPVMVCVPKTVNLLALVIDDEGDPLTITSLSSLSDPSKGNLVNNNDGTVTFIPATGITPPLSISFIFTVSDGHTTAQGTVILDISDPANTAPNAITDYPEDFVYDQLFIYDVRENDSDPEGQDLSIPVIIQQPAHGSVNVEPSGLIKYIPDGSYKGNDYYIYRIYDMVVNAATCSVSPTLSDTAVVNLTLINGPIRLSGTILNDLDGLAGSGNNTVDGSGIGSLSNTPLYVYLVNGANTILDAAQANEDGTFLFNNVTGSSTYNVIISTISAIVGGTISSSTLPVNWVNTGEYNGIGAGSDGSINGILPNVVVGTGNISTLNFGVEQRPFAATITTVTQNNPGGSSYATVPSSTFGGSDPEGAISSIRLTSFPTNTTSIRIGGTNVYTSTNFPSEGILIPTNISGEPIQTIEVDPNFTGIGSISIPYKTRDTARFESNAIGYAIQPFNAIVSISGRIYNDVDGNSDGINDMLGLGNPDGATLYANLINRSTNFIVASTIVNSNGTYNFGSVANGTYDIQLSLNQGSNGNIKPLTALPYGWVNTGELVGSGSSDASVNGLITGSSGSNSGISVSGTSITDANFGIERLPIPNTETAASILNPGGTNQVTVSPSLFGATDESSGIITSIKIISFPANATSITINSVQYTNITFPSGGVTIGTNPNGEPLLSISIDPVNGSVTVPIPYTATDNAGKESIVTGTANVPFFTYSLSGTVYDDANGMNDNAVDGLGLGNPSSTTLYVNLLNTSGNVVATLPVNSNGSYHFPIVDPGNYSVQLSTNQGIIGQSSPSTVLPNSWVNTGENLGFSNGNDGIINGLIAINITDGDVGYVNFGIDKTPVAYNKTYTNLDPDNFLSLSGNTTYTNKIGLSAYSGTSDGEVTSTSSSNMPGKLSGSDSEDGLYAGSTGGNTGTAVFTTLPVANDAVLVYNGILLTAGGGSIYWSSSNSRYEIPDFDNDKLELYFKGGISGFSFEYGFADAAGKLGTIATYSALGSAPLPIKLISFDAIKLSSSRVLVTWATAYEVNNSHFNIEWSNNGLNWEVIGVVKGIGNSFSTNYYSFVDETPLSINYYRLKQFDYNGNFEYSPIRLVSFEKTIKTINVFPNPTSDIITISINASILNQDVKVYITDMKGRVVLEKNYTIETNKTFETSMSLKGLGKGFYFVNICNSNFCETLKIQKN